MPSPMQLLEEAIVARLAAAFTQPGNTHPCVDVQSWPDRPDAYRLAHPLGACLVMYRGTTFSDGEALGGQIVEWPAEFEIGVMARTLRAHQLPVAPGTGSATPSGAYDLLQVARSACLGWRPEVAQRAVRPRREVFNSYHEGVWGYSFHIAVPMVTVVAVEDASGPWMEGGCRDEPLLTQVTYEPIGDVPHGTTRQSNAPTK
jgi:hypothetical protein